ncbi:MAG: molybdopterin-binding oxidoreductase [Solirubrobacteraceae bacterium]
MDADTDPSPKDLPTPARSRVSPDTVRSYRWQLTPGEDVIDPATWAGAVPRVGGIAPRVRVGRSSWFNLLWVLPTGFLVLLVLVAVAKGLRAEPAVERFITRYSGTLVGSHPQSTTGFPAWARWQHFVNAFFMIFIIRAGIQILSDHPRLY